METSRKVVAEFGNQLIRQFRLPVWLPSLRSAAAGHEVLHVYDSSNVNIIFLNTLL